MKCVIFSMVPERDWLIDEQICRELENFGHETILRKFLQDGRDAVIIEKPDVALIPPVRCPYTRDFAIRLKQWGVKVVARRSEAGVSSQMYRKMSRNLQINQIGRFAYEPYIDMELVWGKEFGDILVAEKMIVEQKIRLIGAIGLDVYVRKDYADRITELAGPRESFISENGFDPDKKTVFWACGFKMADVNPHYTLPEAPVGDPIHRQLHLRDLDGRHHWLETLRQLYARYKTKYNFFVRPHPGELCSKYTDQLPKAIAVSLNGTAAKTLVHCDILIHAGSTLAVDAHLLNKPAFNFYGAADDDIIGDISPKCQTADELADRIDRVRFGKSNALIASLTDLEPFYGLIDGKACQRVAQAINEFSGQSIRTAIPDKWPDDELNDYTTADVLKVTNLPVVYCSTCRKPFQVLNGQNRVACPWCGIATSINNFIAVA